MFKMVTIMFWSIFYVNRDYIYPKIYEDVTPNWRNHVAHTLPLIGVLLETYLTEYNYEKSYVKSITPIVLFAFAYTIW